MKAAKEHKPQRSRVIQKPVRHMKTNRTKTPTVGRIIQLISNVFSFTIGGGVTSKLIGRRINAAFIYDMPNRKYMGLQNGAILVWATFSQQYSVDTIRNRLKRKGLTVLALEEGRIMLT